MTFLNEPMITRQITLSLLLILGAACTGVKTAPELAREDVAVWELLRGGDDDALTMEAILRLADDNHRAGNFDGEAIALFYAAQVYLQQLDTAGMQGILAKMGPLAEAHPDLPNVVYSYHTVRQTWHAILYQQAGREEDRDRMLSEGAAAIGLMEKMRKEEIDAYHINPVWNYYNMAVAYDMFFDAPVRDSIAYYLGKAREANRAGYRLGENVPLEGEISIGDEQAWLHYYDGEYEKAEQQMFEVLALIDSVEVKTPNVVQTERVEAYAFLVELYSHTGRWEEALEYEQLKSEADLRRLDAQRNAAVREVEAKYDVAREQAKVERLRGVLVALGAVALLLAAAVLYLHLWRRNRLQMQYSAAVEALVETDDDIRALTEKVAPESANKVFSAALKPLSAVERKYILLFMSGKSTEEIATAMHVEPASVYSMKYRIKKKFPADYPLPF